MNRPSIVAVLCGPPGVGKTTVAARLERRLAETSPGADVRRFSSDDFSSRTYEQLFERVRDASAADASPETDVEGVSAADDRRTLLLVDGTFYRREWRERFRTLGDVHFVRLEAALETCLDRNRDRSSNARIDETGVHVVYREFDPVDADLRVNTDELSLEATVDRVLKAVAEWLAAARGT